MGFIIILPFGALAGWSIFAICRWLRRGGYGREWWKTFAILGCGGLALGIWFAFFTHYTMAKVQLEGFPIPVHIEFPPKPDATEPPSPMPLPIRLGGMLTDLMCGVALCLVPIPVALFFKENRTPPPWANLRPNPPP